MILPAVVLWSWLINIHFGTCERESSRAGQKVVNRSVSTRDKGSFFGIPAPFKREQRRYQLAHAYSHASQRLVHPTRRRVANTCRKRALVSLRLHYVSLGAGTRRGNWISSDDKKKCDTSGKYLRLITVTESC